MRSISSCTRPNSAAKRRSAVEGRTGVGREPLEAGEIGDAGGHERQDAACRCMTAPFPAPQARRRAFRISCLIRSGERSARSRRARMAAPRPSASGRPCAEGSMEAEEAQHPQPILGDAPLG